MKSLTEWMACGLVAAVALCAVGCSEAEEADPVAPAATNGNGVEPAPQPQAQPEDDLDGEPLTTDPGAIDPSPEASSTIKDAGTPVPNLENPEETDAKSPDLPAPDATE